MRHIVNILELHLPAAALAGISGASGSGKTTLLRIISGLRLPTEGAVLWGATRIDQLSERERDHWRGASVGFVFQDFCLFPTLGVLENVLLPATFRHVTVPQPLRNRAKELLAHLGVTRWGQRAQSLSRGEQQRVAVVRALLLHPPLVLADEPTASLDVESATVVMDALCAYAVAERAMLCVASHDAAVLNRLTCRLHVERGRILLERA